MDDFFSKPERKLVRELNLVPVIDMFTTVIFFLLLSTSFYGFTKLTLPPSKVSVNTDPLTPPPLSTKMVIGREGERLRLRLGWVGAEPGERVRSVDSLELEKSAREMAEEFTNLHPIEKTVQLGLEHGVSYQALVSAMDGLRGRLPDIVLISPDEAVARLGAAPTSGGK